ncbi:MAG: NAD-dependent epimerase/dehydratase family protein [Spirochaetaceae bacterium]|nr:NAD-dependent epimerase/dehydratase family protein [Spirochaetaceae bacterium]
MHKTVAVTGGGGYIAGFIIDEFLNNDYHVRVSLRDLAKLKALKEQLKNFISPDKLEYLSAFKADLTTKDGWTEGFTGTDGVIHVASPLGSGKESAAQLRAVAEGGTLNILQNAVTAGVKRVVMTSSLAACTPKTNVGKVILDESFWSDENNPQLDPYRLSKLAAERAAWKFSKENNLPLTTILPGAVFGPIMSAGNTSSVALLLRLINGNLPKAINIPLEVSDVRDLAVLHRLALESEAAINQRFLAASQTITMPQVAQLYRTHYPHCKAPAKVFSNFTVRFLANFVPALRALTPMLNRSYTHSCQKAEELLKWRQHTPQQTMLAAAASFEQLGLIK